MEPSAIAFTEVLWAFYDDQGRHDLPWRLAEPNGEFDAYKILVSELMLQQTQVQRVIPKFNEFLMKFPDAVTLAAASLAEVLVLWSGLGYNRRAKYLWQAAHAIGNDLGGELPSTVNELVKLPGVGPNTAGAIAAYAYNQPALFIETNIRTAYIHHFFSDQTDVSDKQILSKLTDTLDHEHPREFYWALMDYGSYLKRTVGNLNRSSTTYAKQSTFAGSQRQVRGQVLRALAGGKQSTRQLRTVINDERVQSVLADLLAENLIKKVGQWYSL